MPIEKIIKISFNNENNDTIIFVNPKNYDISNVKIEILNRVSNGRDEDKEEIIKSITLDKLL